MLYRVMMCIMNAHCLLDVDISFAIHIVAIVFLSLIQSMARQNGRACVILAFMTWQVHHFFIPRSNSSHYSNNRNAFSPFFAHYTSSSPYIHTCSLSSNAYWRSPPFSLVDITFSPLISLLCFFCYGCCTQLFVSF